MALALSPKTKLGRYEIRSQLGAGGMGEVYLALDTELDRTVALKILPSEVASNQERMRRFIQEAKTVSALNHPNILTIHEIGEELGTRFLATEYVDGVTLRQHMQLQRLNPHEVLDISVQIAAALDAAHEAKVVHRDIKPENIMVRRRDHIVKVLDFGLAKLTEQQTTTVDTSAPTRPQIVTEPGIVIGTAHYMSPEQARGTEVDARSDIFSFGAVIYELVAGCRPFAGSTSTEVIASILHSEAPPLARYSRDVPETLEWIVTKMLRKNREERYQTAKELLSDLRQLKQRLEFAAERERSIPPDVGSGISEAKSGEGPLGQLSNQPEARTAESAPARSTHSADYISSGIQQHKRSVIVGAVMLLVLTIGGGYVLYKFFGSRQSRQVQPGMPSQSMKMTRLTDSGRATAAAISPDGNYVSYAVEDKGKQSLWLRQVASPSEKEIFTPAEVRFMGITFSRDGNVIYYNAAPMNNNSGVLYQVPSLGGTPRKVTENVFGAANLSPDGKRLAFIRTSEIGEHKDSLIIVNADGSGERTLTTKKGQAYLNNAPAWSPDGKTLVCGAGLEPDYLYESVIEVPVEGGGEKFITSHKWLNVFRTAWVSDGSGLVVTAREIQPEGSQIWYVSYPDGAVRRITNDLNSYLSGDNPSLSLTADSSALVAIQEDTSSRIWVGASGEDESRARQITNAKFDGWGGLSWTPDGKILCVMNVGNEPNVWLMNADGEQRKQLTADVFGKGRPRMSPDGRYIAYFSNRSGFNHIWRMDADGGNQRQLTNGSGDFGPQFTPDGQWIVFWSYMWTGVSMIGKVSVDGGEAVQLTNYYTAWPVISPDGKLIAAGHIAEKDNSTQLLIIPVEGGPALKSFNLGEAAFPSTGLEWTGGGKAIAYVDTREGVSNIWSQPIDGGQPKQITNFKSNLIFRFAVSPDGRQLVFARGTQTRDVVLIRDFK